MHPPRKLRVLALCLATRFSSVSAQGPVLSAHDTTAGTETSTDLAYSIAPLVSSTEVTVGGTTSEAISDVWMSSATSEAQVEATFSNGIQYTTSGPPKAPQPDETTLIAKLSTESVPQGVSTEGQFEGTNPTTTIGPVESHTQFVQTGLDDNTAPAQPTTIIINTTTGINNIIDTTTDPVKPHAQSAPTGSDDTTATGKPDLSSTNDIPVDTTAGSSEVSGITTDTALIPDATTEAVESSVQSLQTSPTDDSTTEQPGLAGTATTEAQDATTDRTSENLPRVISTESTAVIESTTQNNGAITDNQSATENQPPVASTELTEAVDTTPTIEATKMTTAEATESTPEDNGPTTKVESQVSSTESTEAVVDPIITGEPIEPTTQNEPEASTESIESAEEPTTDEAVHLTTEDQASKQTTEPDDSAEHTTDAARPKETDGHEDDNPPQDEPGQTSATDGPGKTTAINEPTATEDVVITGTSSATVTYLPEQNQAYSDFTGTTTTTDDGGAAIVLFPGGWFWKPKGNLPVGNLPGPPASNPNGGGGAGSGGGTKEDDRDDDDDEEKQSTKEEEERSTAEPSTTISQTTVEPTEASTTEEVTTTEEATTTTQECSAVEVESCTRTMSYFTTDGTVTYTEFGDCPTIASCATGVQATATETISAEIHESVMLRFEEAEIDIPDDFDADVSDGAQKTLDEVLDEFFDEIAQDSATSTGTEMTGESTATGESTSPGDPTETSNTRTLDTTTNDSTTEETTTVPSTLATTTRSSESSEDQSETASGGTTTDSASLGTITSMVSSTNTPTSIRTKFPCIIRAGPDVETPYCNCATTSDGTVHYVTAPRISKECAAYTEFPMSLLTSDAPVPEPTIFKEPYTETDAGTVLVYKSYWLNKYRIADAPITNTVGLGEASTVSTPLPTATDWNGDSSDICRSSDKNVRNAVSKACNQALEQFDDDTVYNEFTARYKQMGSIVKVLTFGKASCIVQFSCNDYGIGMKGSDIKDLRETEREGVTRCGNIYLSNSCKIHLDYCTNCKKKN